MTKLWRAYLGVGIVTLGLYPFLGPGANGTIYLFVSVSSVLAALVGIRLHQPVRRFPWLLLVAALACFVGGDFLHSWFDDSYRGGMFPSPQDAAYLVGYPLLLVAVALVVRRAGNRDSAAWLDAFTWTVGAAAAAWLPLIAPYIRNPDLSNSQRFVTLAYPCIDLMLLLLVLHQIARRGHRAAPYKLLVVALLGLLASDIAFGVQSIRPGGYVRGEVTDLGWLVAYLAIGTAALHPGMRSLTLNRTDRTLIPQAWTFPVLAPSLVAPAVLVALLVRGDLQGDRAGGLLVAFTSAVVFFLSGMRGRQLIAELRRREEALQATIRDREQLTEELRSRATSCQLTGLVNRSGFMEIVESALLTHEPMTIGLLDLDDFKGVNDTLGHDAGDSLLVEVAARLRSSVGPRDLVARFGGDEFAVLLRGPVRATADALIDSLSPPMELEGLELRMEASLGLVERTDNSALGDLLRRADVAMYAAKASGGNRWRGYEPEMSASLVRRIDLRAKLVVALERHEIRPWYQPLIDLETGRIVGFEALARWTRPGHPPRGPADWISMAEQTGLVVPIDFAVLEAALLDLADWRRLATEAQDLHLAVNASGRTLQESGTAARVLRLLESTGIPPSCLVLEVTEGVLLEDESVGRRLQHLRAEGVRIALDDFGTGWSSLSYLSRFPVDVLKLDQSFTARLEQTRGGEAVPAAVVQLARALELTVIAEGIESEDQARVLSALGAQFGQGYLFGRPTPRESVLTVLSRERSPIVVN